MRKGKADIWEIELLCMDKSKTWSKKYVIARCNIPGKDPVNSKYPPLLFDGVPINPSLKSETTPLSVASAV